MAPMNLDGILLKREIILAERLPLLLSTAILSRFELTKAISMPEKKAEKPSEKSTIIQSFI
jgi:hypothetical protein